MVRLRSCQQRPARPGDWPSAVCFGIQPIRAWAADTNALAPEAERRRQAELYVFALLHHRDKSTLDPLDVSQWTFYVLPTAVLNAHVPSQKQLSLAGLLRLHPTACTFAELRGALEHAGQSTKAPV